MAALARRQRASHLGCYARRNPGRFEIIREQDPSKGAEIEAWADQLSAVWNVLPMDGRTFRVWAKLMHRTSDVLIEDALIAATARVHGLQVVTRNVKDLKDFGVPTLNPF